MLSCLFLFISRTELCIQRNKLSSLCANAQESSKCLSLKPSPQGSLIACFLPCFVGSAVQIYPHTGERIGPFVKHSHLDSIKHTLRSMVQMMATDIFKVECPAGDNPYMTMGWKVQNIYPPPATAKLFFSPYLQQPPAPT